MGLTSTFSFESMIISEFNDFVLKTAEGLLPKFVPYFREIPKEEHRKFMVEKK